MNVINLILLILAAVCFAVAAFTTPSTRINLVAVGLLAWVCVPLLAAGRALN